MEQKLSIENEDIEDLINYEINTVLDLTIFKEVEEIIDRKLKFLEMWVLSEVDFNQ